MRHPVVDGAKWWRLIAGPQPVLRLIALLLAAIATVLYLLLQEVESIQYQMPGYIATCGDYDNPCQVRVR